MPVIDADGTVHVPAYAIPLSRYMSPQAKEKFIARARDPKPVQAGNLLISQRRADVDDYYRPLVDKARAVYAVTVKNGKLGGVPTQTITPREGLVFQNRHRVLLNLHGGGFVVGAGLGGLAESIPVAGTGKFKVVSVDYRMAPEHGFPAASEDVAAVYKALLRDYRPANIGIYGCSAGGILTAMATAWLQKEKLHRPGAIALLSAGAFGSFLGPPADVDTWGGDSRFTAPMLVGEAPLLLPGQLPESLRGAMDYTAPASKDDPLASPALLPDVLAKFPPTLLITGTRAYDMSATVQTHRELTKVGVQADLHLWDGMRHCFLLDVDLPESQEAYAVIDKFFATHLGH